MKRVFNTNKQIDIVNNNTEKDFHIPSYKSGKQTAETIKPQQTLPFEVSAVGSSLYYYKNTERFDVETVGLYEDDDKPTPPVEDKRITFISEVEGATITIYFGYNTETLSDGDSILMEDIQTEVFQIQTSMNITASENSVLFTGKYNGVNYVNEVLPFTCVGTMWSVGCPGGDGPFSSWDKSLVEKDSTISIIREKPIKVIYEQDPDSISFSLVKIGVGAIQPGDNITTFTDYTIQTMSYKNIVYVNGIEIGRDVDGMKTFSIANNQIVDGKAVIKVIQREYIQYLLDIATDTTTNLSVEMMPNTGMWMPIMPGGEVSIGRRYRIVTNDDADIYINEELVAENTTTYIFELTSEILWGQDNLVVKALKTTPTPTNPTFIKDESSDVDFQLGYFNPAVHMVMSIPEGSTLTLGNTYTVCGVASGSYFPFSVPVDVYVNNILIGEGVTTQSFTLTGDKVVDGKIVIKVAAHQVPRLFEINNIGS